MMRWIGILGVATCLGMGYTPVFAASPSMTLDKVNIDLSDKPALQRGAQLFMNHCAGCHSLKYVRYQNMAKDIGIVDMDGNVLDDVVKKNLMFVGDKITDMIKVSMTREDGANWFGIAPPDLSLVTRSRGADWLYTYLRSFYQDDKRPWGVNNLLFPDVAMPHVLLSLQGTQVLSEDKAHPLRLATKGKLNPQQYDQAIQDLVNFLVYVGEPAQEDRKRLGVWVLLFLGVFFVFAFLLKKEYWKDIR
ncbi:MAG: hypothetical protein RLZ35_957 [Pseudomonadota bacterium]|jgi:ubiquinol-cytochrome c reductase cytochrome c1 subunit